MVGQALGLVAQDLDDPAVGHPFFGALFQHPVELCPEGLQSLDPPLDPKELPAGNGVGLVTGAVWIVRQVQQLADRIQGKPELRAWRMKARRSRSAVV